MQYTFPRTTTASFLLAVAWLIVLPIARAQERGPEHILKVSVPATTFRLGDPIPLSLIHENRSAMSWELARPNTNISTMMQLYYLPIDKKEPIGGGSYGFLFGSLEAEFVRRRNDKKVHINQIVIPAQREHRFTREIYDVEHSYDIIIPGRWKAWGTNRLEKLEATPVEFQIVYCADSVDTLFAVASNDKWSRSARDAAIKWLRKVKPNMRMMDAYPDPQRFKVPQEFIDRVHKNNQQNLDDFAEWWRENRDKPATQQAIDAVNREYGLDPVQARKAIDALPSRPADAMSPENSGHSRGGSS